MGSSIKKLFIHCSATKPSMDIDASTIRDWHVNGNGWSDIGYHEVILRNGAVELGRDLDGDGNSEDETGAHAYGHNKGSYSICMVGGIDEKGNADANFTAAQYRALAERIKTMMHKHGIDADMVFGHRDVDGGKACPSFDVQSFIENL